MIRILDLNKANESLKYSYSESVRSTSNLTKSLFELTEKYETIKDESDWRFGHSVERGDYAWFVWPKRRPSQFAGTVKMLEPTPREERR